MHAAHELVDVGARLSLPNSDIVASAPSTTSIFIRKMKNRMTAVEQPKKPQKILRAKASRNVSRTRARVAIPELLAIDSLDKDFLQGAPGARHSFDLALLGAQQIDGAVGDFPAVEMEFDMSILRGEGCG